MKPTVPLLLDPRHALDVFEEFLQRRPGYFPDWLPRPKGSGAALARIFSRYLEIVLDRLNQAPDKNKLAFFDLLGLQLIPARASRAPVVFRLSADAPPSHLPAGAQVAAAPPPEEPGQIVFETERAMGLTGAQLVEMVSLWPGRDQYIDHSEDFLAAQPIQPWLRPDLEDTPHHLYLAHQTLLALAGKTRLDVEFEFTQASSETLRLLWEYWDGAIWRGFKQQHPECWETDAPGLDATHGLTQNGKIRLETDCAETALREVDGVESFWVRALLDEPLPLEPDRILPEISQLRLTTVIEQPLKVFLTNFRMEHPDDPDDKKSPVIDVLLLDGDGAALEGVEVEFLDKDGVVVAQSETNTDGGLKTPFTTGLTVDEYTLRIHYLGKTIERPFLYDFPDGNHKQLLLKLTLQVLGLQPDTAYADEDSLDLTKPFFPLGQAPRPGSVFYFATEEAFTKPGARLVVHLTTAATPQGQVEAAQLDGDGTSFASQRVPHRLVWEYWNGRFWAPLTSYESTTEVEDVDARAFTESGTIELVVPSDIAPVAVNDEEALWMRARLVSGAFGFTSTTSWKDGITKKQHKFTYFIPQPPAIADLRLSYVWEYGPYHAEHVRTYNDFSYEDHTATARWPGGYFPPFRQVQDLTPALYCGFDQKLPVDRLNLFADVVEQA
ncbi:MAG: hypothetical protein V3T28_10930, partial [Gemmatimonadales bacterium]